MPIFPLGAVLFPHAAIPLHVFEPRYRQLTADCLAGDREFGVVLIARGSEVGGGDERYGIGTIAHIEVASPFPDGRYALVAEGTRRIAIHEWLTDRPYPSAVVSEIASPQEKVAPETLRRAESAVRRARALLSELGEAPAIAGDLDLGEDPEAASWRLCGLAPLSAYDGQRLLEIDTPGARLVELSELAESLASDLTRLLAEPG
jgi:Lon protease-like protein